MTQLSEHERLEDLELAMPSFPKLKNQVVIPTDTGAFVYVGRVSGLHFSGVDRDVYGHASLTKNVQSKKTIRLPKLVSVWPPRLQLAPVTMKENQFAWSTYAYRDTCFISDGEPDLSYRKELARDLENQSSVSIQISPALLDRVFAPIDAQIKAIYDKTAKFSY